MEGVDASSSGRDAMSDDPVRVDASGMLAQIERMRANARPPAGFVCEACEDSGWVRAEGGVSRCSSSAHEVVVSSSPAAGERFE